MYGVEGVAEGECVEILLSSALKSLAYLPETLLDSRGVIDFTNLYVKDAAGKANAVFVTSAPAVAKYRVNPHNADVTNVEWSVLTRGVQTRAAVPTITVEGVTAGSKGKQGYYDFALVADGTLPAQCTSAQVAGTEQVLASLVATTPEGEVIVSDEAYAQQVTNDDYQIINHDDYYKDGAKNEYMDTKVPELVTPAHFELVYNSSINIIDSLETYASDIKKALPEINVEPTYVVSLTPATYVGADGKTNQQKFVTLAEDGTLTVNSEFLTNGGRAAIGRTPVVKVYSYVNEVVVDSAYLKVAIVDEEVVTPEVPDKDVVTMITKSGEYEYAEIGYEWKDGELVAKANKYETIAITWEEANTEILEVLGLSYDQFVTKYDVNNFRTLPVKAELPAGIHVYAGDDNKDPDTSTNFAYMTVDCKVSEDTTGTVKVIFPAKSPKVDAPVAVEFTYTVSHEHVWPEFNPDYLLAGETVNTVQVKGKKVDGTWKMTSDIKEHFKNYTYSEMKEHHSKIEFTLPLLDKNGVPTEDATTGIAQEGAKIENGSIFLTAPLEVESKDYVIKMTETLCNKHKCVQYYEVRFVSPFVVTLADVELKTLIAKPDAVNLDSAVEVKDTDGNVIVEFKNNQLQLTDVAKNVYGLTVVPRPEYELVFAETGNDTAESFGDNLNLSTPYVIWDNDGTDLQNNKVAKYTATVTFKNICELTEEANVTVLSTANSKANSSEYAAPTSGQFVFKCPDMSMGDETRFVLDLGVNNPTGVSIAVSMNDWQGEYMTEEELKAEGIYNKWGITQSFDSYNVVPKSSTSGMIIVNGTVQRFDPLEGFVSMTVSLVAEYSNYNGTTMNLISDYDNLGISNSTSNGDGTYSYSPVIATKSSETLTLMAF